jgi:predicted RND superfamily exporter protein
MFPREAKIRGDIDLADRNMLGSQTLKVYFDLGREYALHDPYVLRRIDALQRTIETRYAEHVVRTLSLVDVAKNSYMALNEDRREMYVVPPTRAALANTFFMFDNSNPSERRKMVSDDYSRAHIDVALRNGGSWEYTRVFAALQQDIDAANADLRRHYPESRASVTGLFTLIMQGSDYLAWSSLSSFAWSIVTISAILLLIFGSVKAGIVSVVANAVPVTMTFGLMGLMGVPLDFNTVLIAPIVLGMAVDDTIHFLTHYRHEVARDGNVHRALNETIREAGQAVTYTSMILALGLGVLALSSSPGNANVGIYGALAVIVGWVCELLLTPAMILIFGLKFPVRHEGDAAAPRQHLAA